MNAEEALKNPLLRSMVDDLGTALGERLASVVLYGSAARDDFYKATSDFNLVVVLENLEPETLAALRPPFARWHKRRQPTPRIFSPALIAESADVFPIEFLDLQQCGVVLHGADPLAGVEIHLNHLRLQCEREFREKMMRLRAGWVATHRRPRALRRLLAESYSPFVALFRGCLHLLGGQTPVHNEDVVSAFCERAGINRSPFEWVQLLKRGQRIELDPASLFSRYYEALTEAVHRIERFEPAAS